MNKKFVPKFGPGSGPASMFFRARFDKDPSTGGATEQAELLKKINDSVKEELNTRGYSDKAAVEKIIGDVLKDVNVEALRNFDASSIKTSVNNIATELEKVKNIRVGEVAGKVDRTLVKRAFNQLVKSGEDGKPGALEMLMRGKGADGTKEVVLNIRAAATMTTTNTIDENEYPDEMIESMNMLDGVVAKRRGHQYIFDIADVTTVAELEEYTTWLEEGDIQGAFALVAQGAVKPLVSGDLVRNFVKARKVAAKMVITEEFAKWRKKAWNAIQRLINDKLIRDYAAILTVDLQAQAASYVGTSLDGTIVDPTDFDAIGAVAAQIETLNFYPDVLILHPQDKWRLALEKDSEGRYYMMIPMIGPDGIIRMMGFRVITSTYQTIGSFTLGEAGLFKIEQEAITIRFGYGIDVTTATVSATTVVTNVASDFDTNKLRMIIENFFKDYIATNHLGSFVTTTFATVKAALEAA